MRHFRPFLLALSALVPPVLAGEAPAAGPEWKALKAPLTVVEARRYRDGGTVQIFLKDADGKALEVRRDGKIGSETRWSVFVSEHRLSPDSDEEQDFGRMLERKELWAKGEVPEDIEIVLKTIREHAGRLSRLDAFQPPVTATVSRYLDGGSLGYVLKDGAGHELAFCLDGRMQEQGPSRRIFLGVAHPDQEGARILLPGGLEEGAFGEALQGLVEKSLKPEALAAFRKLEFDPEAKGLDQGLANNLLPVIRAIRGLPPAGGTPEAAQKRLRDLLAQVPGIPVDGGMTFGRVTDALRGKSGARILVRPAAPVDVAGVRLEEGMTFQGILDVLSKASGMTWKISDEAIVFSSPPAP